MSVCILNIRPSPVCVVWWRCKNAWSVSGREWRDHSCCFSPVGLMTSKSRKKCCSYEITAESGENLEENPRWLWASAFAVVGVRLGRADFQNRSRVGRLLDALKYLTLFPRSFHSRVVAWRRLAGWLAISFFLRLCRLTFFQVLNQLTLFASSCLMISFQCGDPSGVARPNQPTHTFKKGLAKTAKNSFDTRSEMSR